MRELPWERERERENFYYYYRNEARPLCWEMRERMCVGKRIKKGIKKWLFKENKVCNKKTDVGVFAKCLCKMEKVDCYVKIDEKF